MVLAEEKRYSVQPPRQPRKKRIAQRTRQRKKVLSYCQAIIIILSCFGCGIFYIYKNNQVTALGYRVEENRQRVAVLQRDFKQLELEAAELQGPDRVEEVAIKKLRMNKPNQFLLAVLPPEKDNTADQKPNTASEKDSEKKKSWSVVFRQFIGRAEASTR